MEEQKLSKRRVIENCLSCLYFDYLNEEFICNKNCYDIATKRYNKSKSHRLSSSILSGGCSAYQLIPSPSLLISIITLAARNDLLQKTLTSLYHQLYKEANEVTFDTVITVDGTNKILDDVFSMFEIPTVHYVDERVGICESLNRSLSARIRKYDYVMFCDDDIEFVASITPYIKLLQRRCDIGVVSGYHDCRMEVTKTEWFEELGQGLIKPITSGCHLVMRVNEVIPMMPFKGGHLFENFPFIGFDHWVMKDNEYSIEKIGKKVVVFPDRIKHLGKGRSTWEGIPEHDFKKQLGLE